MTPSCRRRFNFFALRDTSFNHIIRRHLQRQRHGEAERLGGLEVDDQFELGRRLHGKIARLLTAENAIDVPRPQAQRFGSSPIVVPYRRYRTWWSGRLILWWQRWL